MRGAIAALCAWLTDAPSGCNSDSTGFKADLRQPFAEISRRLERFFDKRMMR
jgi:hypothetical protein